MLRSTASAWKASATAPWRNWTLLAVKALELYFRIIDELGSEPLAGSLLHLCLRRPDGGLRYLDVWESEQACARAFDARVHPAVDRAFGGKRPEGEPTTERLDVLHASGALLGEAGR